MGRGIPTQRSQWGWQLSFTAENVTQLFSLGSQKYHKDFFCVLNNFQVLPPNSASQRHLVHVSFCSLLGMLMAQATWVHSPIGNHGDKLTPRHSIVPNTLVSSISLLKNNECEKPFCKKHVNTNIHPPVVWDFSTGYIQTPHTAVSSPSTLPHSDHSMEKECMMLLSESVNSLKKII